jgi:prefoldin subunit 5
VAKQQKAITTIEQLAIMVANSFTLQQQSIDSLSARIDRLENRIVVLEARIDKLEERFNALEAEMRQGFSYIKGRLDQQQAMLENRFWSA